MKKIIAGQTGKLQRASHYARYAPAASWLNCLAPRTLRPHVGGCANIKVSINLIATASDSNGLENGFSGRRIYLARVFILAPSAVECPCRASPECDGLLDLGMADDMVETLWRRQRAAAHSGPQGGTARRAAAP